MTLPPPATSGDPPAQSEGRFGLAAFLLVAIALSTLVGISVGLPDYLPTNDGPEHVFASHAARHLDDPGPGYGRFLKLGAAFSQIGFDRLFSTFERILPWRSALRASLVTMTLLWSWGVVALAAAVGGRRRVWLGLFGFAVAVQWQLYMGFFSFYMATGIGFYVLALALWRGEWTTRWRVMLAAALACQALVHPVPAMATGAVFVIARAWDWRRSSWMREVGWLALMAVPAALIALTSTGQIATKAGTQFLSLAERAAVAVLAFVSGPSWRAWTPPLCALVAAILAVASKAWREDRRRGALLSAGLLFALIATLAPHHIADWEFFSMRFTPLATIAWVLLLPFERWPRPVRLAGLVLLVAFAASSNLWALGYNLRLREASADLLSGLDAKIRRSGMRLPLIIEPRAGEPQVRLDRTIPYATANWNVGSLYAVEQGGVPAWTFAESEQLHSVVWRWPEREGLRPPRPDRGFEWALSEPRVLSKPGLRQAEVNYLLSYAPYYEDVIFYGRPEEVAWLHERRFIIDYQRGGLAIARFHACPATLELTAGTQGHSATILAFGWAPAIDPSSSLTLPAVPSATEPRPWRIGESPCGAVWFRVLFDNDGDGRVSPGDSTCLEANPQGFLGAHIEEGGSSVPCHPGRLLVVSGQATDKRN